MRIRTLDAYRLALTEIQTLETAREGEDGFARRHELIAATHAFEQLYLHPSYRTGKPAPFALKEDGASAPAPRKRRGRGASPQ